MMKRKGMLLLLVALVSLVLYSKLPARAGTAAKIGAQAPAFALPALDGQTYTSEQFRGKPLIINFWASWCEPCKAEAPALARLYERYKDRVGLVAVNITAKDRIESVREFVSEHGLSFPVLLDERAETAQAYRIVPIPTTYLVDRSGMIADKMTGAADDATFEKKITALLQR
ncbi:TlpA family protein disulfide reductase [Paenibacillus oleatilyticus]|uniref:TlpA family protein disulfide reductase n=1 Tax=Paenibacillus oleatilyticus TaxID=2594886 RepID=UPI001C1FF74D|nr:TlpA disulfide reductase family protein [Paenibacillus oleatilyticus]MBU7315598.1 TlpA family protein disulfide reductase [Paenibacillus oleatilyticus]